MRPIGFSTGALALSDFRLGLKILRGKSVWAVELSALRENELAPLIDALDSLDLSKFKYISLHAPSKFEQAREEEIIDLLKSVVQKRGWPIVLHPDTIYDFSAWQVLQNFLLIENMDKRNPMGRTTNELSEVFDKLPLAGLCFDIGHCRQVDPTMNESFLILRMFGRRLKQLHISEVNSRSTHDSLSETSIRAFEKISYLIPDSVPVIVESRIQGKDVESELDKTKLALPITRFNEARTRVEGTLPGSAI